MSDCRFGNNDIFKSLLQMWRVLSGGRVSVNDHTEYRTAASSSEMMSGQHGKDKLIDIPQKITESQAGFVAHRRTRGMSTGSAGLARRRSLTSRRRVES
jgi:hypothetical protein